MDLSFQEKKNQFVNPLHGLQVDFMHHIMAVNTLFGHFLGENPDTGQKKSFCNSGV